jgi:hypothetical protein
VKSEFPMGVAMKSHLDDASRNISGSGSHSLESPLQGNLHGGFGGGSEETCESNAPCSYPTESRMPGSERGVGKHNSVVRPAPTLLG